MTPLTRIPAASRPIVSAAFRAVHTAAPQAQEIACAGEKPRSPSMMWKLARFAVGGKVVVTIGTFTKHACLFFARGSEIEDEHGLLEGTGQKLRYISLRAPADAQRAAVKAILRHAFAQEREPAKTTKKSAKQPAKKSAKRSA